ncbi:hypothetical protein TMES_03600 [Thalassospira mesophila]|uniref:Uncharacterized protein n=1 Tax=Thalassospira mesophila TaxID=1293891 RepID=A0A1Y2L5F5_9PROT|nr:hypothetical protein TMES_03600 [Thalassospira mesophila]
MLRCDFLHPGLLAGVFFFKGLILKAVGLVMISPSIIQLHLRMTGPCGKAGSEMQDWETRVYSPRRR